MGVREILRRIGFLALALATLLPAVQAWMGLLAGIVFALVVGNPWPSFSKRWTPRLLQASIVGLGAGMDLRVVLRVGVHGIGYTVAGIALALLAGALLGSLLAVSKDVGLLVTVGTAICGGSAIAAVAPVVRAKDHEISVSLATVFLLTSLALLLFPPLGHALGLDQGRFGLWAALAIHDTSSVVGAARQYGDEALRIATTVKLARALWIVPLALGIAAWRSRTDPEAGSAKVTRPWFIAGFVAAAALVTFLPALASPGQLAFSLARQLLVLTLFLIGANLSPSAMRSVGTRPLLLGLSLWAVVGLTSLVAILAGIVHPG